MVETETRLVISTHLKYIRQIGSFSPKFGMKIPKIFELPPPQETSMQNLPQCFPEAAAECWVAAPSMRVTKLSQKKTDPLV